MIRVIVQDENCTEVGEGIDIPAHILSRPDDTRFNCLRFVDPYGDTIFNRIQCVALLEDIRLIRQTGETTQYEAAIKHMESLIKRCQSETHLYLKFIGD